MKKTNEIVIDSVHHVLVPDSDEGCSSCSLREECFFNSGKDAYICALIMKEPFSHFEIKKRKVYTKKNNHETTKRDNN